MTPLRNDDFKDRYVSVNQRIANYMANYGCSRLEAIASLDFGDRSDAAKRVLYKRSLRLKLINAGFTVEDARAMAIVVDDCN